MPIHAWLLAPDPDEPDEEKGLLATIAEEAGETIRNAQDAIAGMFGGAVDTAGTVVTGAQDTIGGAVTDVTAVPSDVLDAGTKGFLDGMTTIRWIAAGLAVVLVGDFALNEGKATKRLTG